MDELNTNNINAPVDNTPMGSEPIKKNNWWLWLGLGIIILALLMVIVLAVKDYYQKKKNADDGKINNITTEKKDDQAENKPAPLVRYGSIKLSSQNTIVKVGDQVTVSVLMDTAESNIVLAAARIKYDATKLQLEKIDPKNSVLSMAIMQKKEAGKVEIVRGAPGNANPDDSGNGYTGQNGLMVNLEFKALSSGTTAIEFIPEESNLLLDDGLGTKMILTYENVSIKIE